MKSNKDAEFKEKKQYNILQKSAQYINRDGVIIQSNYWPAVFNFTIREHCGHCIPGVENHRAGCFEMEDTSDLWIEHRQNG